MVWGRDKFRVGYHFRGYCESKMLAEIGGCLDLHESMYVCLDIEEFCFWVVTLQGLTQVFRRCREDDQEPPYICSVRPVDLRCISRILYAETRSSLIGSSSTLCLLHIGRFVVRSRTNRPYAGPEAPTCKSSCIFSILSPAIKAAN